MSMHVDESGDSSVTTKIDNLSAAWNRGVVGVDALDAITFHDHYCIGEHFSGAVHQLAKSDRFDRRGGSGLKTRKQGGNTQKKTDRDSRNAHGSFLSDTAMQNCQIR